MIEVFDNPEAVETLTLRGKIKEVANSANIAAVFMYDTRLDTDGGAWRKKCAGLSWYDETLNSATRGNRKEFPSRALIVADNTASSENVSIYDADDPALPLWMKLSQATDYAAGSAGDTSALFFINGRLYITNDGTPASTCLIEINFVEDRVYKWSDAVATNGNWLGNISERNSAKSVDGSGNTIVNKVVNDVAAHVYAVANLDRLGLPIPTVAVATDGGVSVIHPSGDVYDSGSALAKSRVEFNERGQVLAAFNHATDSYVQISDAASLFADGFAGTTLSETTHASASSNTPNFPGSNPIPSVLGNRIAVGTDAGVTIYEYNLGSPTESLFAYLTSKYCTGFMHGDIRGAWGLDKDHAATIVGSELVTNGDFATDTVWIKEVAEITISGGEGVYTACATGKSLYQTSFGFATDTHYIVEFEITSISAGGVYISVAGSETSAVFNTTGVKQFSCKTPSTLTNDNFNLVSSGITTATVDNVSVRLAIPDRSVKGNGLGVYGTLNVGAVSTGADLRALSGFSTSIYAEQPYNSDLDFGTGDFHISFWMKLSDISATQYIISYGTTGSWSGAGIIAFANGSGQISFQISDDGFATSDNLNATPATDDDVWHKYDLFRRGSKFYLYTDSKEEDSTSVTNAAGSLTNSSAVLRVGNKPTDSTLALANGSLSIPHISATAPTPEQIKDMYEMERPLFFDNALCTLQADQVNDVSYDPVTDVLEVAEEATSGSSRIKGLEVVEVVKSDEDFGLAASKELDGITAVNGFRAAYTDGGAGINVPARDASSDLDIGLDGNGRKDIEFDAVTTDNTATVIGKIPIDENEFVAVDAMVRGAGYNDGSIYATYHIVGTFTRDIGGNVTLRGTVQDQHTAVESTGSYNAELVVDTTAQTVDVRVTGGASDRIQWHVDAQVNWKDDHHY